MICENHTEIPCQSWTNTHTQTQRIHAHIHKSKYTKVPAPLPDLFHTHMHTWQDQEPDIFDSDPGLMACCWRRLLERLVALPRCLVSCWAFCPNLRGCRFINEGVRGEMKGMEAGEHFTRERSESLEKISNNRDTKYFAACE